MKESFFQRFLGFFTAMFAGLFMNNAVSHKDRLYERMARHNQEVYNSLRGKLQKYANKFLLPLEKRDKHGFLVDTKRTRKYKNWIAERKLQLKEKRGLRWFDVDGVDILALNMKNAIRKRDALGVYA